MTIAEAAKRFGVPASAVSRARKEVPSLSVAELALAALTGNGTKRSGTLSDTELGSIAGWVDYVNHDGCTGAEVRGMLEGWVTDGVLLIDGSKWKLVKGWP